MAGFHGYMYRWGLPDIVPEDIESRWQKLISEIPALNLLQLRLSRWQLAKYKSKEPLSDAHKVHPELANSNGFFEYPMLFRVTSLGTVIITSSGSKVVKAFVQSHVNSKKFPELVPRVIKVNELTNFLVYEDPDDYAITSLSVNVDASGENLERADYYGGDLGAAPLVSQNLDYQTPFMIGLRDRKKLPSEMLRLGSRGYINLSFHDDEGLDAIEHALSYIWSHKFYYD